MADREPLHLPTLGLKTPGDLRHGGFLTGDHDRLRTIHGGNAHPPLLALQQRQYLILGGLEGDH
ncbi:hypothetical protein AB0G85_36390, partial [Streptomyces sioyaensis]